jgi:hypothetical protein
MAEQQPNRDDYFVALPLEASEHAFTVEVVADAVQLAFLGPVTVTRATFTRREARDVALALIGRSQQIVEEES